MIWSTTSTPLTKEELKEKKAELKAYVRALREQMKLVLGSTISIKLV